MTTSATSTSGLESSGQDDMSSAAVKPSTPNSALAALTGVGDFVSFCTEVFKSMPHAVRHYPGEITRHAADLVRQNAFVILFMEFMLGAVLTLTLNFMFANLGIDSLISAATGVGGIRGIIQIVFGWIVAAKVGCGIVAEIGSMRISEEIDAMEVMGIPSIPYLISTRVVAGILVLPLVFITGMAVYFSCSFLFATQLLNTVSPGGFVQTLFLFQNLHDLVLAIVWGVVYGVIILLVSSYFGYTAKGGPVGVGRNTAQSMLVNLVMVSLVGMMLIQLFYGDAPNAPIGN
jgi:phospholipid/cholesterol/gamma-HCH transport system permease protein